MAASARRCRRSRRRSGTAQQTEREETTGALVRYYVHAGYGIAVKFLAEKSQSEIYIKEGKADISDAEIAALLKANAMGSDWQGVYDTVGTERWELNSREATAVYSHSGHTFTVSTKVFIRSTMRIRLIDTY